MADLDRRLTCCICGGDTLGARDYLEIRIALEGGAEQYFGAHADCFQRVLAEGFHIEILDADGDEVEDQ